MSTQKLHSCIADKMQRFIELRRLSGTDYQSQAKLLEYFDRFLVEKGLTEPRVTREITDAYQQSLGHLCSRVQGNRLAVVRQLCGYLTRTDPQCYVPERRRSIRSEEAHPCHIYSTTEVRAILAAASELLPLHSLRPETYRTLLGLLYSTGIRIGEAFALNLEDFHGDQRCLWIAKGKFRKARWVPLSSPTSRELQKYVQRRQDVNPKLPVQKGLADNTILAYRDAIKLLLCYAADTRKKNVELSVANLDESLVLGFLDHVETVRGCSPKTRNARLAAIRAFFTFMAREEPTLLLHCQAIRAIPVKRTEHKMVDYLEEKEIQAMLDAVDVNARTGIRDKALLLLLYNTGARVSEVVELHVIDLRLDNAPQVKLLGKGKKHRSCPLWPETVQALQAYLQERAPKDPGQESFLLNANGFGITRFGVHYIIRKYAAKAENACASITSKSVNPHTIRHYDRHASVARRK